MRFNEVQERTMKHLGTVKSFDHQTETGFIKPDSGAALMMFERSGIYKDRAIRPLVGQRLIYELVIGEGNRKPVNLQSI
jgi:cold shock CspA family protein